MSLENNELSKLSAIKPAGKLERIATPPVLLVEDIVNGKYNNLITYSWRTAAALGLVYLAGTFGMDKLMHLDIFKTQETVYITQPPVYPTLAPVPTLAPIPSPGVYPLPLSPQPESRPLGQYTDIKLDNEGSLATFKDGVIVNNTNGLGIQIFPGIMNELMNDPVMNIKLTESQNLKKMATVFLLPTRENPDAYIRAQRNDYLILQSTNFAERYRSEQGILSVPSPIATAIPVFDIADKARTNNGIEWTSFNRELNIAWAMAMRELSVRSAGGPSGQGQISEEAKKRVVERQPIYINRFDSNKLR